MAVFNELMFIFVGNSFNAIVNNAATPASALNPFNIVAEFTLSHSATLSAFSGVIHFFSVNHLSMPLRVVLALSSWSARSGATSGVFPPNFCSSEMEIPNACSNLSLSGRVKFSRFFPVVASCDRNSSNSASVFPVAATLEILFASRLNPIAPNSACDSKNPSKLPIILSPI